MKIFQTVQKNLLSTYKIGLDENPFNCKILMAFLIFCAGIISNCVYFFYEAKTFQDYVNSIFFCELLFAVTINFVSIALNMRQIFGCLLDAEKIIDGSKLAPFYF